MADALQQCNSQRTQELRPQSLSLRGRPPGLLLLPLPPQHLTQLCAAVDFRCPDTARHLSCLTALRKLDMSGSQPFRDGRADPYGSNPGPDMRDSALAPLQHLQHLT